MPIKQDKPSTMSDAKLRDRIFKSAGIEDKTSWENTPTSALFALWDGDSMSSNELRDYIFDFLGIENKEPWINIPTPKLIEALRENAGYTQSEVGQQLDMSVALVSYREKSNTEYALEPILALLRKRCETLVKDGWLEPDSLHIKEELYEKVAIACRKLRGNKSEEEFEQEIKQRTGKILHIKAFETHPHYHPGGTARTPSNLMSITEALCAYRKVNNVWELIDLTSEIPEPISRKIPEGISSKDAGRATGALLDFMGLNWECLVPKVFARREDVSHFFNGTSFSGKKINVLPHILISSWQQAHPGEKLPEAAHFTDLPTMVEKGLRLAALDKALLRDAVSSLLDKQNKDVYFLADAVRLHETTVKNWFRLKISSQYGGRGVITYHIAKMAEALGVEDIFALEEIGKAAAARAQSDQRKVVGPHTDKLGPRQDRQRD